MTWTEGEIEEAPQATEGRSSVVSLPARRETEEEKTLRRLNGAQEHAANMARHRKKEEEKTLAKHRKKEEEKTLRRLNGAKKHAANVAKQKADARKAKMEAKQAAGLGKVAAKQAAKPETEEEKTLRRLNGAKKHAGDIAKQQADARKAKKKATRKMAEETEKERRKAEKDANQREAHTAREQEARPILGLPAGARPAARRKWEQAEKRRTQEIKALAAENAALRTRLAMAEGRAKGWGAPKKKAAAVPAQPFKMVAQPKKKAAATKATSKQKAQSWQETAFAVGLEGGELCSSARETVLRKSLTRQTQKLSAECEPLRHTVARAPR